MTSTKRLGIAWLAMGLPVGALLGVLTRFSDHADERRAGDLLLVLALLSLVLGVALVQTERPVLRAVSLALSGLWASAAVVVVAVADFTVDRLWGGGLTLLVATVTGALALAAPHVKRPSP